MGWRNMIGIIVGGELDRCGGMVGVRREEGGGRYFWR